MAKYKIEYCCTYFSAVWLYEGGGINGYIDSDNDWDVEEEFDNVDDASKAWEQQYEHTYVHEDTFYDGDEPEIGLTLYALTRYSDDGVEEEVLACSTCVLTPEDIQAMYPEFDFEEASK